MYVFLNNTSVETSSLKPFLVISTIYAHIIIKSIGHTLRFAKLVGSGSIPARCFIFKISPD